MAGRVRVESGRRGSRSCSGRVLLLARPHLLTLSSKNRQENNRAQIQYPILQVVRRSLIKIYTRRQITL